MQTVDAMVSTGLRDLGYNYINIDDCWQALNRDPVTGNILADADRFPNGMKYIGDYIHSKGMKFGIYSSAGFKTCQEYPASLGLESVDVASYVDWGVDYLKYDNCYQDFGTPQHRYTPMATALQASGRNIFYSLCEWGRENPATWAKEISHAWRVSGDIRDDWDSILTRAAISAPLWRYAGPGGWNDPDMLEVGNGKCTEIEYNTHFSLWAMLKAPLIIGNDIRSLSSGDSDSTMTILSNKNVIAVNQDPLGHQARRISSDTQKLLQKISSLTGGKLVIGDNLIATKCSSNIEGAYEDAAVDQQWSWEENQTIKSKSTGRCLYEVRNVSESSLIGLNIIKEFGDSDSNSDSDSDSDSDSRFINSIEFEFGSHRVTTIDCSDPSVTKWDVGANAGGNVISKASGLCLEVARLNLGGTLVNLMQGKRIQMGRCQDSSYPKQKDVDVSEHQSWSLPKGQMLSLYQRSCLTVNRDAPVGLHEEVWLTDLVDGSIVVMFLNKSRRERLISVDIDLLGLVNGGVGVQFNIQDLWTSETVIQALHLGFISRLVPSHGSVLLKIHKI